MGNIPTEVKVQAWSICPLRSPVTPGVESDIRDAQGSPVGKPASQTITPCIYLACGFWKITKVQEMNGQNVPVDGMCGIRYLAETFGEAAGALQQIAKLMTVKTVGAPTWGTEPTPPKAS